MVLGDGRLVEASVLATCGSDGAFDGRQLPLGHAKHTFAFGCWFRIVNFPRLFPMAYSETPAWRRGPDRSSVTRVAVHLSLGPISIASPHAAPATAIDTSAARPLWAA